MFTGIVETHTPLIKKTDNEIIMKRPELFETLHIGQSIAVNGACLSVTKYDDETISFTVLSETFRKTNLGSCHTVNVERAMLATGRFEGHIVLGHIDETIPLLKKQEEISGVEYIFAMPSKKKYLVTKGSIGINGVSLTIGNITENTFSVFLIPLTLTHTNLGLLQENEKVNIEYDYIAKLMNQ